MPRGSSGTTTRLRWCTSPTCTGSWGILWSWTGFKCTRSGSSRGAELMGILGFIARRLLLAVPVFVGVTLVTFVLMQIVPGDPVALLMEEKVASVDPDAARIIRAKWGLDDPVPLQYLKFLRNAVRGDLGISYRTDRSVLASILERVPATAKGLADRRVLLAHALRNAAIPIITVIGVQLSGLLSGAVITERVFSWPGIGRLLVDSIAVRDLPMVQGCVLFIATVFIGLNLCVDLSYVVLDPRIKYE